MSNGLDEFYGADPPWDYSHPGNESVFHQAGMDGIDPAYDGVHAAVLAGAIGFDPADVLAPSVETRQDIEQQLPQWGPPFVAFVDGRLTSLEKKVIKEIEKWQFQTRTDYFNIGLMTDATGTVNPLTNDKAVLYSPPPGFTLALHRLGIFVMNGVNNFGTPLTGANAYFELRIGNEVIDGGPLTPGSVGLPQIKSWGTRDALRVRDGEVLSFFCSGIAAAVTRLNIKGQGSLDRTIEG